MKAVRKAEKGSVQYLQALAARSTLEEKLDFAMLAFFRQCAMKQLVREELEEEERRRLKKAALNPLLMKVDQSDHSKVLKDKAAICTCYAS